MSFLSLKTTVDSPTQHPGWNTFGGLGHPVGAVQDADPAKVVAKVESAKENRTLLKTLLMFVAAGVLTKYLVKGMK